MIIEGFSKHIDQNLIDQAQGKLAEAKDRRVAAGVALDEAKAGLAAAKRVSNAAVAGDGDPIEAEIALEAATRAVVVAGKVNNAADTAVTAAESGLRRAIGRANQPMHDVAVDAAIAACKLADGAREIAAQAEANMRDAVKAIVSATACGAIPTHGHQAPDGTSPSLTRMDGLWQQPTEEEARKRFGKTVA